MDKIPILSICIATLNRGNFIGETLDSILSQITPDIEIVIIDGASTDNTEEVINKYVSICNQIKYFRLEKKGGVDNDYCKAVELATGKMCWLFTDDDIIIPGSICNIIKFIKQGFNLIILNVQKRDFYLKKILQERLTPIHNDIELNENEMDTLFSLLDPCISFIGCVIINREIWLSREKEKYVGTEFIHVGVIFQQTIPGKTLLIADPYIYIRWGNAQWVGRTFKIWAITWPNLLASFDTVSINLREKYFQKPSWYFYNNVTYMKRIGYYSFKDYTQWYKNMEFPIWWRFLLIIIAILPHFLFKLFMNGFAGIKKRIRKFIFLFRRV